jgi:hypothetical protein
MVGELDFTTPEWKKRKNLVLSRSCEIGWIISSPRLFWIYFEILLKLWNAPVHFKFSVALTSDSRPKKDMPKKKWNVQYSLPSEWVFRMFEMCGKI